MGLIYENRYLCRNLEKVDININAKSIFTYPIIIGKRSDRNT